MQFTLGEAARQCSVAKGTISKAIASGKLSATRREDGSWSIDAAELARYLEANRHRFRSATGSETRAPDRSETDALVAALRETIASLKQANDSLEAKYVSLERDRNEWREQAKRLALPAPRREETPAATPANAETVVQLPANPGVDHAAATLTTAIEQAGAGQAAKAARVEHGSEVHLPAATAKPTPENPVLIEAAKLQKLLDEVSMEVPAKPTHGNARAQIVDPELPAIVIKSVAKPRPRARSWWQRLTG